MKCRLPGCEYKAAVKYEWPMCEQCMVKTIRRVMDVIGVWPLDAKVMPTDPFVYQMMKEVETWVIANVDMLIREEIRQNTKKIQGHE